MFSDTHMAPYLKKLSGDCWAKEHLLVSETTFSDFLQTPLPSMVALGYVLVKQEILLFGLKHRDDPKVCMLYEIAKMALNHEAHYEETAIDGLLDVCNHNCDQYKWILEAIEEDGTNTTRVRRYADNGLLYSKTRIPKYSRQSSIPFIPEPIGLPQTIQASTSRSTPINSLRTINSETKRKTDMEWASDFIEERKAAKRRMNWQICFDKGREAGYFKTCANT